MKFKNPISFLIFFLLLSVTCFSQSIVNRANSSYTVQDARFSAQYNLFVPRYTDTVQANLAANIGNDSCSAVIYLYSTNTFWYRSCAGGTKAWVDIGAGGGGTWGSITGTLSDQTDLQSALNLKAPLISPLFTTPRLNSTSTTGYVWTATDASGNGSFQAIPSDNLIVQNAGSGTQTWFTSGDTLYMKKVKNTTFISASTDADSSLLISLSATGTPSSSTYLRGDNTWATVSAGISSLNTLTDATQTFATGTTGTNFNISSAAGVHTFNIPDASASARGVVSATTQTFIGSKTFNSLLTMNSGATIGTGGPGAAIYYQGAGTVATPSSAPSVLFGSASVVAARAYFGGSVGYTISANNSYGGFIFGGHTVTEASSGTQPEINAAVIKPVTITDGASTTTDATTLKIEGPPTGVTTTNPATSLWIKSGDQLLTNGNLTLGTAGNKINIATGTNASVGISAAMTAGSITISTTAVTANSIIQLTPVGAGTGQISIGTITAGTSFVINSSDGADTRIVHWTIIN